MKFIHLSDLHLGKRLNDHSLIEDQEYILSEILKITDAEKPDGVIIAGDVYDKGIPSAEAVNLLDSFLFSLSERSVKVFVISGNHDSPDRLAFGGRIFGKRGICLSPVYNGEIKPVTVNDEYGQVNVYLLPFIKPSVVRGAAPDREIQSYTDALTAAVDLMKPDFSKRNILVAHQFVTGAGRCDSEAFSVGGSDNVDSSAFSGFDYVALGHIHGPQNVGGGNIRYCGTPLKYSFSEMRHEKSATVVTLGEKGDVNIRTVPLTPLYDLGEIRGKFNDILENAAPSGENRNYMRVILTDEVFIPNAAGRLRAVFPRLASLEYDNSETTTETLFADAAENVRRTPAEVFAEFYSLQNGTAMNEKQLSFVNTIFEEAQTEADL